MLDRFRAWLFVRSNRKRCRKWVEIHADATRQGWYATAEMAAGEADWWCDKEWRGAE